MRIRWWQSIRWRLALGFMLVALLATALLALVVTLTIDYYYGVDQRTQLTSFASANAQSIGVRYVRSANLAIASASTLDAFVKNSAGEDYIMVVFNHVNQPVYPRIVFGRPNFAAILIASTDPSLSKVDYAGVRSAVLKGQQGIPTVAEIGESGPVAAPRPFTVQPIFAVGRNGTHVVGVLFMTPRSAAENTLPPFIANVRQSVLIASAIVALLAILAALLFSRTITRPLAKLTKAAQSLTSGNYAERVKTRSRGELGELANTFNEMATQLERDVNELHRQELWRRELIMNITHDLATPLTAIAGLGDSLVDGVNRSHEDYEATGRIIVRETLRLRRLVKDLHMMAKVEAGAMQPVRKTVRLAVLVDEVLAVLTPEFERTNVEPRNNIPFDLPPVQADPDMLARVFSNLCDNALRHTPAGGTITIDAVQRPAFVATMSGTRATSFNELASPTAPPGKPAFIEISVTDSGEGIPTGALPRVFDRFYRADPSRHGSMSPDNALAGGSGLGLAIVRAIIEAHGGSVRAENTPQGGARIIFTLPLDASEPASISSAITLPLH